MTRSATWELRSELGAAPLDWRPMNVFVLCTGRSGSTTFVRACNHITNFSAGHETRCHFLGDERFAYPPDHIEADSRLVWLLGRLDEAYGDDVLYVHLTRDPAGVAQSLSQRFAALGGIAPAYRDAILCNASRLPKISRLDSSFDYVETALANIRLFLRDKTNVMDFALERAERDFAEFWDRIGAEGSYESAVGELRTRHNAGPPRHPPMRAARRFAARVGRAAWPPA